MAKHHIYDASGDIVSTVTYDAAEKKTTFAQWQDLTPYLEQNKKLQTLNDGYSPSKELRRVASIPNVLMLKWLRDDGISPRDYFRKPKAYKAWLRRKIYNPDNRFVLTAPHKA